MHASPELRRAAAALPERPNLDRVVNLMNRIRDYHREPKINPNRITVKQAIEIKDWIKMELSPEWLHCDGEISHAEAMAKKRVLEHALAELHQIIRRPWQN